MEAKWLRRDFLISSAASALAAASDIQSAEANPVETQGDDASVRWFDDEEVVIGPEAAAASATRDGNDFSVRTKFYKIFARGPLVATSRAPADH